MDKAPNAYPKNGVARMTSAGVEKRLDMAFRRVEKADDKTDRNSIAVQKLFKSFSDSLQANDQDLLRLGMVKGQLTRYTKAQVHMTLGDLKSAAEMLEDQTTSSAHPQLCFLAAIVDVKDCRLPSQALLQLLAKNQSNTTKQECQELMGDLKAKAEAADDSDMGPSMALMTLGVEFAAEAHAERYPLLRLPQ